MLRQTVKVCDVCINQRIRFLFLHVELCRFEDHVSFDNEMFVAFLFYFSILLLSLCKSKALKNIVGLIVRAVDRCVYLQISAFLLSSVDMRYRLNHSIHLGHPSGLGKMKGAGGAILSDTILGLFGKHFLCARIPLLIPCNIR